MVADRFKSRVATVMPANHLQYGLRLRWKIRRLWVTGLLCVGCLMQPGFALGQESIEANVWNEFRGPNGSGVLESASLPDVIDATKPTWQIAVPEGHSSPVLAQGLVILTGVSEERLVTLAIDQHDGQLVWSRQAPETTLESVHETSSPAASTPFVDGERIYVYFGSWGLICYDLEGNEVWSRHLETPKSLYGMTTSPVVHHEKLLMVLDDDRDLEGSSLSRSRLLALNKLTGETIWETARPLHRSGWSTPTIWPGDSGDQLVVLGNGRVCGYDLSTGEELWHVNGFSRETVARPVLGAEVVYAAASMIGGVADEQPEVEPFWEAVLRFDANGDDRLQRSEMTQYFTFPLRPDLPIEHPGFGLPMPSAPEARERRLDGMFTSIDGDQDGSWSREEFLKHLSFDRGRPNLLAIRPGGAGEITETHLAWELHRSVPEIPSPIYHHERLYLVNDGGVLSLVDAVDGSLIYRERVGAAGHYRASPVIAGKRLYLISESGVLTSISTGDEFRRIGQTDFEESVSATPALDLKTIYIRTAGRLLAFRSESE